MIQNNKNYSKTDLIILIIVTAMVFFIDAEIIFNGSVYKSHRHVHAKQTENKSAPSSTKYPKEIYLTFDDGPTTYMTPKILSVLQKYNVHGTFFIVGKEIPGREHILTDIVKKGNALGLHTFSHNFIKVYSDSKAFIDEMDKTSDEVKHVLNVSPSAIRFPGGSSKRLSEELLNSLHHHNYKIYDWNVTTNDGINPHLSSYTIYQKAIKSRNKFNRIFLLLHCNESNKTTYEALPSIIEFYKQEGYKFNIITNTTPEYYFRIKGSSEKK